MGRPVVYFEIGCRDRAATGAFYEKLFGWTGTEGTDSIAMATGGDGIDGHVASLGHAPHHYTMFYVAVDDLEDTLARTAALGGSTLVEPQTIPDGRFAWISDLEGNTVGLLQTDRAAS
jgi:uncharacterized protein